MRYPETENSMCLPGTWGEERNGELLYKRGTVSVWGNEKVLETDSVDDYTTCDMLNDTEC
jgi:hypothetical protein